MGACVWFKLLKAGTTHVQYLVMGAGALNGIGGSTILVLSLSLTADLIDQNTVSISSLLCVQKYTSFTG